MRVESGSNQSFVMAFAVGHFHAAKRSGLMIPATLAVVNPVAMVSILIDIENEEFRSAEIRGILLEDKSVAFRRPRRIDVDEVRNVRDFAEAISIGVHDGNLRVGEETAEAKGVVVVEGDAIAIGAEIAIAASDGRGGQASNVCSVGLN